MREGTLPLRTLLPDIKRQSIHPLLVISRIHLIYDLQDHQRKMRTRRKIILYQCGADRIRTDDLLSAR